jgi:hypothetical protein
MILHERCNVYHVTSGDTPVRVDDAEDLPCEVSPLSSIEPPNWGEFSGPPAVMWNIYVKAEGLLQSNSRIEWRGHVLQVEGDAMEHYVRGRYHHSEARMTSFD